MTYDELAAYAKSQFTLTQTQIADCCPAGDMYIDDLCFPLVSDSKNWVSIPNGIRFWLENGDSIIYVKNKKGDEVGMLKLKPCPFCGGIAKLNAPGYEYYSPCWCKCTQCGAEGPTKLDELEAEKGWNERVQDDVEPHVMTLEEVEDALDSVVWVDRPLFDNSSNEYALIDSYSRKLQIVELRYPFCDNDYRERSDYATYGKTWRCWTHRPTDEQRNEVAWE